jgi:DNA modification methylase
LASISDLRSDHKNARKRTDRSANLIKESISRYGAARSIVIDEDNRILAGNGTIEGAKAAGIKALRIIETDGNEIIAVRRTGLSEDEKIGLAIADNRTSDLSEWDTGMLQQLSDEHDLAPWFEPEDLDEIFSELQPEEGEITERSDINKDAAVSVKLADRFGVAPFTVLNAREGWWQERKRQWISCGIQSEVGRKDNLLGMSETILEKSGSHLGAGTSIFDPVLAELAYRWFSPQNGIILDPFAGGSVRGIVAVKTDRQYIGCDLRQEQIDANKEQGASITPDNQPIWHCSDSRNIDRVCKGIEADMIFSCPPYADLEVYSDNPKDLSTLEYKEFVEAYREIIAKTCSLLKQDAFACFVVGDVRDKKGNYYNFVGDTIQAFLDAGLSYYNEAILITCVGTLPIRAGRTFASTRKLGKTHQNVLVFLKGNAKKAVAKCGECDFAETDPAAEFGEVME